MATSPRRLGSENAESRLKLMDATERVMVEHGYAAVSSRRVADEAGLKHQLVHYYFRTMDELFVETFRRRADQNLARLDAVLSSDRPLHDLWAHTADPRGNTFTEEFVALANHRDEVRTVIAEYAERFRATQIEVVTAAMERAGVDAMPPDVIVVLMTSVSRVLAMEDSLGVTGGHASTRAYIADALDQLEPAAD